MLFAKIVMINKSILNLSGCTFEGISNCDSPGISWHVIQKTDAKYFDKNIIWYEICILAHQFILHALHSILYLVYSNTRALNGLDQIGLLYKIDMLYKNFDADLVI